MRSFSSSWRKSQRFLGRSQRTSRKSRRVARRDGTRLGVELLEDRRLLAVLTVNSLLDNATPGNGLVTLREAILAANNNTTTDLGQTGSGFDEIVFSASLAGTINITGGQLTLTEPVHIRVADSVRDIFLTTPSPSIDGLFIQPDLNGINADFIIEDLAIFDFRYGIRVDAVGTSVTANAEGVFIRDNDLVFNQRGIYFQDSLFDFAIEDNDIIGLINPGTPSIFDAGIWIENAAGGTNSFAPVIADNVIGENEEYGIRITGAAIPNLTISDNFIGVIPGSTPAPAGNGVGVQVDGNGNLIDAIVRNAIFFNGTGVVLSGADQIIIGGSVSNGNEIAGNVLEGVRIVSGASGNFASSNEIHNNGASAIAVGLNASDLSVGNILSANTYFLNGGLPIDLLRNGVIEPNDANDADSGPNMRLNHPVVIEASIVDEGNQWSVPIQLDVPASGDYLLEFYQYDVNSDVHFYFGFNVPSVFAGAGVDFAGEFDIPRGLLFQPGDRLGVLLINLTTGDTSELVTRTTKLGVLGDYNLDGSVDAADYTVWRNTLGSPVAPFVGADGNGNGMIDQADYDVWKTHYGETLLSGAGSLAVVPGDYNVDGTVNAADYGVWEATLGSTILLDADGDLSGVVDMADYYIWAETLNVTTDDILPGDYDDDGVVAMSDYDVWHATFGSTTNLAADGNGNGVVDAADYTVWRDNLGATSAAAWPHMLAGSYQAGMPLEIPDQAPHVTSVVVSGSASAHPAFDFTTVDGSAEQLRSVPVGATDSISITFSEEVFVSSGDLSLVDVGGAAAPTLLSFTYVPGTRTATWRYNAPLTRGQYLVRLSDGIVDLDEDALDGEFTNPWSVGEAPGYASTFPSGDGESGGEFRFRFTILNGDYNGDNSVDAADYTVWANNNGLTGATSTRQGDGNGSGAVNSADHTVWASQYGFNFTQWPSIESGAILVSTLVDESDANYSFGDLSLREALAIAASNAGPDIIAFHSTLAGGTITQNTSLGRFIVGSDVTIEGPGSDQLTVQGNQRGLFWVSAGATATIRNLEISGGNTSPIPGQVAPYDGAGVKNDGALTLDRVLVTGGFAINGGGISQTSTAASTTIIDSTISNNFSLSPGGGIYLTAGSMRIESSTISGNSASSPHGGIFMQGSGSLTMVNSTVSGNQMEALRIIGSSASATIVNSTFANNTDAAGMYPAGSTAGGVVASGGASVKLFNTIVAGNTGGDVNGVFHADSASNLIGNGAEGNLTHGVSGNQVGTAVSPINAMLLPLADYGGPTKTHTLLVGSPAIDAGNPFVAIDANGLPLSVDQRGRSRVVYAIDIGALEREILGDYNGDGSVDAADYTVWRNNEGSTTSLVADGDGSGKVDDNDYDVWKNHFGNGAGPNLSTEYGIQVVSTNVDDNDGDHSLGDLSLREALARAVAQAGPDMIVFRHTLDGQTIVLGSELTINSVVEIVGRGADLLTVSGNNAVRVFNVPSGVTAEIRDLRIANGSYSAGYGGGVSTAGNLTLDGVAIENSTSQAGGAIYAAGGTLAVVNSTLANNFGQYVGGGAYLNGATSTFTNSTVSSNGAQYVGGGIYVYGGSLALDHVTVANNAVTVSTTGGGGLGIASSSVVARNSIIADNVSGPGLTEDNVYGSLNATLSVYNLIGLGGAGGLTHGVNGNKVGVANPGLAALGLYGGRTRTHALLAGSQAIDAGDPSFSGTPSQDQRGKARVADGDGDTISRLDIGAFELAADEYFGSI